MSIEALCKTYPDVPKSVLLKTDVIRLGIRVSQAAQEALKGMDVYFKGLGIFSQDTDHAVARQEKIPYYFKLKRDDTRVVIGVAPETCPYYIDWNDGGFVFCDETGVVEEVCFEPAHSWTKQTFEDGTPYLAVAQPQGIDLILGNMSFVCDRWARQEQCLYCDIGYFLEVKKEKHEKVVATATPQMLAEVFWAAQKDPGIRHFCLSSGSVVGERDGKSEVEWQCEYLNTISERINGNWMSSWSAIQPTEKDGIKVLHDTGVPALMINTEVWDERLFNILCPGKARSTPQKERIRWIIEAVDIFGKGKILSNFVTGVEMAQPWGFKDALSAVKSTLGGFDYLMAHGVLPRDCLWWQAPGSALAGQPMPPLEYFIELGRGFLELRQKHNFPFPFYGWCRGCYCHSAIPDWDYYLWGKES